VDVARTTLRQSRQLGTLKFEPGQTDWTQDSLARDLDKKKRLARPSWNLTKNPPKIGIPMFLTGAVTFICGVFGTIGASQYRAERAELNRSLGETVQTDSAAGYTEQLQALDGRYSKIFFLLNLAGLGLALYALLPVLGKTPALVEVVKLKRAMDRALQHHLYLKADETPQQIQQSQFLDKQLTQVSSRIAQKLKADYEAIPELKTYYDTLEGQWGLTTAHGIRQLFEYYAYLSYRETGKTGGLPQQPTLSRHDFLKQAYTLALATWQTGQLFQPVTAGAAPDSVQFNTAFWQATRQADLQVNQQLIQFQQQDHQQTELTRQITQAQQTLAALALLPEGEASNRPAELQQLRSVIQRLTHHRDQLKAAWEQANLLNETSLINPEAVAAAKLRQLEQVAALETLLALAEGDTATASEATPLGALAQQDVTHRHQSGG
jgi:hypothetical protein